MDWQTVKFPVPHGHKAAWRDRISKAIAIRQTGPGAVQRQIGEVRSEPAMILHGKAGSHWHSDDALWKPSTVDFPGILVWSSDDVTSRYGNI